MDRFGWFCHSHADVFISILFASPVDILKIILLNPSDQLITYLRQFAFPLLFTAGEDDTIKYRSTTANCSAKKTEAQTNFDPIQAIYA